MKKDSTPAQPGGTTIRQLPVTPVRDVSCSAFTRKLESIMFSVRVSYYANNGAILTRVVQHVVANDMWDAPYIEWQESPPRIVSFDWVENLSAALRDAVRVARRLAERSGQPVERKASK